MTAVRELETLLYEESGGVAVVTLNRPEALNAFNQAMEHELQQVWKDLRTNDDVRCIVLTGAGDRAFCTGIDRNETITQYEEEQYADPTRRVGYIDAWTYDDPGTRLCPKTNDLWKPVIAAVNGLACAGAFYLLGEVEFIIAAEHATFFDPHVTFGMTPAFEPAHLMGRMPFGEVMRMSLLGSYERISAGRALQIGLVSEVVPGPELAARARWAAQAIADQPAVAVVGAVRANWMARELSRRQALEQAYLLTSIGNTRESMLEGQERFARGPRIEWRLR
jgi:enoyl-CoA hydratase/carnithine racemase